MRAMALAGSGDRRSWIGVERIDVTFDSEVLETVLLWFATIEGNWAGLFHCPPTLPFCSPTITEQRPTCIQCSMVEDG